MRTLASTILIVIATNVARMRASEVAAAFWLVEEHTERLLAHWRRYHG